MGINSGMSYQLSYVIYVFCCYVNVSTIFWVFSSVEGLKTVALESVNVSFIIYIKFDNG